MYAIETDGIIEHLDASSHQEAEYLVACMVAAGVVREAEVVGEVDEEIWLTEDEYKEFLAGLNPWTLDTE